MENIKMVGISILIIIIIYMTVRSYKGEEFGIWFTESNPWGLNVSTSYKAQNSGYGLYGRWPKILEYEPWRWWMWGRGPEYIITPYTEVPQIDYNRGGMIGVPRFNIEFSEVNGMISAQGEPHKMLQLDRNKVYYISVFTPTKRFMISKDKTNPIFFEPTTMTQRTIIFGNDLPDIIYYCDKLDKNKRDCGEIYLNKIRADMVV